MNRTVLGGLLVAGLLASGASAGDRSFDSVVREIESSYDAQRLKIPFFGLVKVAAWVARPAGVSRFDLAIFEDIGVPRGREERFLETVGASLGAGWRPIIHVSSPRQSQWTAIFARPDGQRMKLLLAVYQPGQAVVVQMRVHPETFADWAREPTQMASRMRPAEN